MATPIPKNVVTLSLGAVADVTSGTVLGDRATECVGVCTDTRELEPKNLFVALRGERFDGGRFAADAMARGAAATLCESGVRLPNGTPAVIVDDALEALGAIARQHRRRWGGRVVAIAGSAGKTTTRSCVAAALDAVFPGAVHATTGNLNNRVGVPMVLLGLTGAHRVAVVEIGTNVRGEVAVLTDMAGPEIGVLTLIDVEHAEGIGDLDAIEAEEGDLFAGLSEPGVAIGNGDDARVRRQLERARARQKRTYGAGPSVDYRIVRRQMNGVSGSRLEVSRVRDSERETLSVDCPLVGLPGALGVVAALAVVDAAAGRPVDPGEVAEAMARLGVGEAGRLTPIELRDGTIVVDDSYNANPASVVAAAVAAREIADVRGARLLLVLGEMRELGELSESCHAEVGRQVAAVDPAGVIGVAGDADHLVRASAALGIRAEFVPDADSALDRVLERVRAGDVVLVKASRGVGAERVVDGLIREKGRAA